MKSTELVHMFEKFQVKVSIVFKTADMSTNNVNWQILESISWIVEFDCCDDHQWTNDDDVYSKNPCNS